MLTGQDLRPMKYVENLLKMHDIPVIVSNASTFDTMDRIRRYGNFVFSLLPVINHGRLKKQINYVFM